MTESDLKLIDFHVTDITCHVNTGVSEELPMSIKSSVSARMPEEFDGSLYIYLKTTITGQDESLFLLDVLTETIVRLPEGKTELDENDAPPCITFALRRSYKAILEMSKAMGIAPPPFGAGGHISSIPAQKVLDNVREWCIIRACLIF